ncbi:MAG: hypothetical protein K6U02_09170 [Firmicutes bacterium]|nr:hypothetical protein [Bacillota bacterium]
MVTGFGDKNTALAETGLERFRAHGTGALHTFRVRLVKKRLGLGTMLLLVMLLATVLTPEALAQGCSMCVQNAAATGEAGRKALNAGILILLTPTLLLFGGVFFLLHRRSDSSPHKMDSR